MSETLRFFVLQTTLLAVVLILHTYLGLHIVRRTLVFSDLVLDQLAAFGVLISVGLGIEYGATGTYLASFVAVIFGAALLALLKPSNPLIPREAIIGILYALALVASLLVGDKLPGGGAYVTKTLAGAMLWVTWPLVCVTVVVYAALLAFHFVFRANFIGLTHNTHDVKNVPFWDFLFFTTQGVITVLIVPVAGVLLAYAFLMIPAATAAMFTNGWKNGVLLGWSLGLASCLVGLTASHHYDLPYGPSLVLALGTLFVGSIIVRSLLPRRMPATVKGVS